MRHFGFEVEREGRKYVFDGYFGNTLEAVKAALNATFPDSPQYNIDVFEALLSGEGILINGKKPIINITLKRN
jgi:hypothetical protein